MNKKSFFLGFITGVVVTFIVVIIIGMHAQPAEEEDPIQYLEKPESYENKTETSFQVFQVLGNMALADEVSDKDLEIYSGKTVAIPGENFYDDQVITIKNPKRIGSISYTNKGGSDMTVPVIEGTISK